MNLWLRLVSRPWPWESCLWIYMVKLGTGSSNLAPVDDEPPPHTEK